MESDERLYERLRRGELDAFDALHARYERGLFGFILAHVVARAEAEEVLHETFLALLRSGPGFGGGSFRAWIHRVARNLCLNRLRGRKREARALGVIGLTDGEASTPAPDAPIEARQRSEALGCAVARLPPPLGEVFHLRASGLSYDEMAAVLSLPVGTVKSRMHEMVNRLREEMKTWIAS